MTVTEALHKRRATPSFDSKTEISKSEIERLIDLANFTPSSMNLQPWEFLICMSNEEKARMQSVAMNQAKVSEASAVIAVVCNLNFPDHAEAVANGAIERGYFIDERKSGFIKNASSFKENSQSLRDEAIRSCNLWAMAFMMVATESGWDSAPMGGFVPEALTKEFGLPDSHFPTILIAIGKANPAIKILERNVRFSAASLAHYGNWR